MGETAPYTNIKRESEKKSALQTNKNLTEIKNEVRRYRKYVKYIDRMENYGALVMGKTLLSAFDAMDLLERAAMMTHITQSIANYHELTDAQLEEIRRM